MGKPEQLAPTSRDREILECLARRVRALSVGQIARTWWSEADSPRRAALGRLRLLKEAALVSMRDVLVHPELRLAGPVIAWRPGLSDPDFPKIAYKLQSRWTESLVAETIVVIENGATAAFGGYPAPALRTDEITHDLHLASVYLTYRARMPEVAANWVGERVIRKTRTVYGGPVPDAMLRGDAIQFVEFGGAYSKERIRKFHAFCVAKATPYELW